MRFFLFACLLLTIPGLAKQYEIAKDPPQQFQEYVEQFDANRSPSAVVAGCVHVLTGEYFDSCQDLVTSGSNPIVISCIL